MIPETDIPSSSSPPLPATNPLWPYDVFLSFRGKDTRRNFTDHLYTALNRKGIITFRDDENLKMGKSTSELFKAIKGSRYVIAILSSNYADSTWCLDELVEAVECKRVMGQTILPVFYHVHPSEVRNQSGNFEKAFLEHEQTFKDNIQKVQRWRAALVEVADLFGWYLEDGYESKLIQTIVAKVFTEVNQTISSVFTDLVGMDSRIKEMLSYLQMGSNEVRIIGIWGMGGIGKTTIARVVSERINSQFEACSFLANVREVTEKQGIVELQKQLLSDILLETKINIRNPDMGTNILSQRLRTKVVLIILDDVDHVKQLEALCGNKMWFGSGSRIIITSRDEHLLIEHEVDDKYQVNTLNNDEALQLFNWKSFRRDQPEEDFIELSKNFLQYARGLPLAIEVLGSSLFLRGREEWSSTLDKLKENPDKTITNVLKVSYDGLQEMEKKVFLDIACFFKGEDKHRITRILESSYNYSPVLDINVLTEKSLLAQVGRHLWMHDMIQELGWEIVRRDNPEEVGKRSRLWVPSDVFHVLAHNRGTTVVQSILLDLPKEKEVNLTVNDPFLEMDKLRLLKIRNGNVTGNIKYLSNELALLEWHDCPLNSLPSHFQSEKLVELNMNSSRIKQLWTGEKHWSRLTLINMSDSQYLTKTPDFAKIPNLETLVLEGCTRLVEVHASIGLLKKLILLNMKNCKSVETLPPSISLKSLKIFTLSGCSRLKKFPEIEGNMNSLLEVYLGGTAIEELPSSIEHLTGLTLLDLEGCKKLLCLPSAIQFLTSLKSLILADCSELDDIPENLNCMECLEELDISGTAIRESLFIVGMKNLKSVSFRGCKDLPSKSWYSLYCWWCQKSHVPTSLLLPNSFSTLTSLAELDLSDCNLTDGVLPNDLGSLFSLKKLNLSGNNFVRLPESICQLTKLESLNLSNCRRLQLVPKLPLSVRHVNAGNCTSLMDYPNQFKVWTSGVSGMTTINSRISSQNQESCTSVWRDVPRWTSNGSAMVTYSISSELQECEPSADEFSIPVQVFHKDLELFDYRSRSFGSVCRKNEIPEWFIYVVIQEYITILIPPDLKDDGKWLGVAVCGFFSAKRIDLPVSHVEYSDFDTSHYYHCKLETREFGLRPVLIDSEIVSESVLCVFYIPCAAFPKMLNESSVMAALFETDNPYIEIKKCGIRLLYEEDVQGFIQTLMQLLDGGRKNQMHTHNCHNLMEAENNTFTSGWYKLDEDNILRWEKSSTCKEGSTAMLRRNIESVLPRYLEGLHHKDERYAFPISGCPVWFNPQVGSSVSIELPENLHKSKKWMGFALCASLALDHRLVKEDYQVIFRMQRGLYHRDLTLRFTSQESTRHLLLVFYLPWATLPKWFTQSSSRQIGTAFRTDSPRVNVQFCGLRTLYWQDLQGFVQAITHCILRTSAADMQFFNKVVVEEWLKLISLQRQLTAKGCDRELSTPKECNCHLFSQNNRQRDWSVDLVTCRLPGIEIPKWFMPFHKGDSALLQLPPNLFDDGNWMGVAVCALFSIQEHPSIILDTPDSEFSRALFCDLEGNIASALNFRCMGRITSKAIWLRSSDFTWLLCVPRVLFSSSLNQCNLVRATVTSCSLGVGLHECALRLVFKKDAEDLEQLLTISEVYENGHHCEQEKDGSQR